MTELLETHYQRAAEILKCDVSSIKAVAQVEAGAEGPFFEFEGRLVPVIRFERHWFYKLTSKPYSITHPHLSHSSPGGYARGRSVKERLEKEYRRFLEAYEMEPEAAVKSASFGMFQIMGFNHDLVGYTTTEAFLLAMESHVINHLNGFILFIKANPALHRALVNKDWVKVAFYYNGPDHWKNRYSEKMAHYDRVFR